MAGAVSGLLMEFGVVAAINKILSPLMKPLYGLPGASVVGVVTTYLSDNPALLTLAGDDNFKRYFKKYQLPALTNIGTAFGMGMIITTFMIGIKTPSGGSFVTAALIGNLGAIIGSVIGARLMLLKTKKLYGTEAPPRQKNIGGGISLDERVIRIGSVGGRFIESMLEGGKNGVVMGASIIPGVLIICTVVMMLTNGPSDDGTLTGAAYGGIGFLPWLAEKRNSFSRLYSVSLLLKEFQFRLRLWEQQERPSAWCQSWLKEAWPQATILLSSLRCACAGAAI